MGAYIATYPVIFETWFVKSLKTGFLHLFVHKTTVHKTTPGICKSQHNYNNNILWLLVPHWIILIDMHENVCVMKRLLAEGFEKILSLKIILSNMTTRI